MVLVESNIFLNNMTYYIDGLLHPEVFVTELCVTCHAVSVTIFDLLYLNILLFDHILKVTCLFGFDTLNYQIIRSYWWFDTELMIWLQTTLVKSLDRGKRYDTWVLSQFDQWSSTNKIKFFDFIASTLAICINTFVSLPLEI